MNRPCLTSCPPRTLLRRSTPALGQATHREESVYYANLGCGTVILPCEQPKHHGMLPAELYSHPHWHNIDRNDNDGVNVVADLFSYPWRQRLSRVRLETLPSDFYGGAILSHLVEHIPHSIDNPAFAYAQDGWFAFFDELWRVLRHGAVAHILAPYALSSNAFIDPTHTRYLMPQTFSYFVAQPDAPYKYSFKARFAVSVSPAMRTLADGADGNQFNQVSEFYVKLRAIKE